MTESEKVLFKKLVSEGKSLKEIERIIKNRHLPDIEKLFGSLKKKT